MAYLQRIYEILKHLTVFPDMLCGLPWPVSTCIGRFFMFFQTDKSTIVIQINQNQPLNHEGNSPNILIHITERLEWKYFTVQDEA